MEDSFCVDDDADDHWMIRYDGNGARSINLSRTHLSGQLLGLSIYQLSLGLKIIRILTENIAFKGLNNFAVCIKMA